MSIMPRTTRGCLREEVVEVEEVAVERVLADEAGVAAVVVQRDVVEPLGRLALGALGDHGRVREAHRRIERRERVRPGARRPSARTPWCPRRTGSRPPCGW